MLRIIGDMDLSEGYFDRGIGVGSRLMKGENPLGGLPIDNQDFWIGNFECVCSDVQKTGEPFIINPQHLDHFRHCDLYGIANNHVMQHGAEAYRQMIEYFDQRGIPFVGSDNKRSVKFRHQGKQVGVLAFSQRPDNFSDSPLYWHLPELSDIEYEIDNLRDCDFKIAFLHWGFEFINYPNIDQKKLGHWLIDKGIDLVIGMHPHISQGYEIHKGKHIFYSLGNCVFNMPWEPTRYGLMVNVDLSATPKVDFSYLKLENYFPKIVKNVPFQYSMEHLNSLLQINQENEIYFAKAHGYYLKYRKTNRKDILRNFLKIGPKASYSIIKDFISRR